MSDKVLRLQTIKTIVTYQDVNFAEGETVADAVNKFSSLLGKSPQEFCLSYGGIVVYHPRQQSDMNYPLSKLAYFVWEAEEVIPCASY